MRNYLSCLLAIIAISAYATTDWTPRRTDWTLWYDKPAQQWEETVPLGNGRLGMMPDGGVDNEKIVLNEISMWSGCEADYSNPEASKCLPAIQQLLLDGRNKEAQDMMYEHFVPSKPEKGGTYGSYQMLADLDIKYKYSNGTSVSDYHRWLDLSEAVAYTAFTCGNVSYLREYYVPRGNDLIVAHITADKSSSVNLSLTLSRPERANVTMCADNIIQIDGTFNDPEAQGGQVLGSQNSLSPSISWQAALRVFATGDNATTTNDGNALTVSNADEAWIVVAATTDYWHRIGADIPMPPVQRLSELTLSQLTTAKADGIAQYRQLFGRAGLCLAATAQSALPTDRRIEAFVDGEDPELAALYYNYGRYLLISSTLPGYLPPNLQGLWANGCGTPWNGDYHTNINVQMNHWPVEPGNLSELHLPLIELVKRSVPSGERTAKAFYGDKARGWVMHMMTNVWNYTEPGEHPSWGATNTGGAWLCAHLWEHHLYNPTDTAYLSQIYPVLKGAADFFLSTMITETEHGWLVTAPSSSPENEFVIDGHKVSVCMGPTMDTQIVRELFGNVITAAETLGIDNDYASQLQQAMSQLPPMQIGSDGRLMEWLKEYPEADPHHRHVSHLYGLHPGNQISPVTTPELAEACRRTLDVRGDGGTGWSRAWKVNFWARLGDGDRAYSLFRALLEPAYTEAKPKHGSGTFPNLFCSHPPFQMDGNWGGASGISEMLVQSHDGFVNLLPALPTAMADGSLHGFKVRDGATVDLEWSDGQPTVLVIDSPTPQRIRVPAGTPTSILDDTPINVADGFFTLPAGRHRLTFYVTN